METYDDIQAFSMIGNQNSEYIETRSEICNAVDLAQEIESLDENESWEIWHASAYNEESIVILYLPDAGRAGIAWGADASWTDCDSAQDALERYFGVDEKEMNN